MKLLPEVIEIINNHNPQPIILPNENLNVREYLKSNPKKIYDFLSFKNDHYFLKLYGEYVSKGHYGFALSCPINPVWSEIIDDILEICINEDPNFQIFQIKIKFGRVCFYVQSDVIEDVVEIQILLSKRLFDEKLIY